MAEVLPTTNAGSRVRLISTRDAQDTKPEASALPPSNRVFLEQMTATLTAIAAVLAARLLLLLASMGAFMLAYLAMQNPDGYRLAATVIYNLGVVAPITWLYYSKG